MNNYYKHKYFEKNSNELHTNIFRSLEIEQYLQKVLKNKGFNLHEYKINFSNFVLNIFLSIHKTERKIATTKKNFIFQKKNLIKLKKKIKTYYKKKSFAHLPAKIRYIKTLTLYKDCLSNLKKNTTLETKKLNNLSRKILESLNLFTKNKFSIILTVQEINFVNSNPKTEQALLNFRKFEKTPFFTEGKILLIPLITQKNPAKLLGTFIATQLRTIKRHNFFFNFLKESLTLVVNQKFSKIQGIKILIKGRLNNAARSRHKLIKTGKISLITTNSKIDYSESTAFTSNGTLGIKIWICEKLKKKI